MLLVQALVHVSTAYCNCDRSDVAETIYSPPYSPDDIISLVQWLPEDLLDKVRAIFAPTADIWEVKVC